MESWGRGLERFWVAADGHAADDHDPAGEPECDGGSECEFHGDGERDRAVELSMAVEWSEPRWSDERDVEFDECDDGPSRQLHLFGDECGRQCHEQYGDLDGECCAGGPEHHDPAGEPECDGRSECEFHGGGERDHAAELSMAI